MINNLEISLLELKDLEDRTSDLKNCIRNHYRHLKKWAKRTCTDCFRIYDRDIKAYPIAIDMYRDQCLVHYFSSSRDNPEASEAEKLEIEKALFELFGIGNKQIHWRTRVRRKETEQYEKLAKQKEFFTVHEYGVKFHVNLVDYLDTGLFLDHRETRQRAAAIAQGKRVLNLFAYTCSFSVHAALAGAASTTSVDLSNTYTKWGKENFLLNGLSMDRNKVIREDCLVFLDNEVKKRALYDLIIIDPPTLSRSKKMEVFFDIQKDYVGLISKALKLLDTAGVILFSTNARKFFFNISLFPNAKIQDISDKTAPPDFRKKIHSCWKIYRND
jgi:23S rRNA (cytosine1962-C5)-methyltransferase